MGTRLYPTLNKTTLEISGAFSGNPMIEIPKIAKLNNDANLESASKENANSKTRKKASKQLVGYLSFPLPFFLFSSEMNSHVQGLVASAFAKFEVLQLNCSIVTMHSRFVLSGRGWETCFSCLVSKN
jgi:hypothetical protein